MQVKMSSSILVLIGLLLVLGRARNVMDCEMNMEKRVYLNGDKVGPVGIECQVWKKINVLKWDSPFQKEGKFLRVVHLGSNKEIKYIGPVFKRVHILDSYSLLNKDEKINFELEDISKFYDLSEEGEYSISLNFQFKNHFEQIISLPEQFNPTNIITSENITIKIIGMKKVQSPQENFSKKRGVTYHNCGTSQTTTLNNVVSKYNQMRSQCLGICTTISNTGTTTGTLYTSYFGSLNQERFNRVYSVLSKLDDYSYIISCGNSNCPSDAIAYVYPTDSSRRVYVCSIFWTTQIGCNRQSFTQAGTIVHELAHFDVIGNCDDIKYGETDCKNLAATNPASAIYNADNFAIFCEKSTQC